MTAPVECRFLEWDSDFFGHRIARVVSTRLDPVSMESVRAYGRSERIECFYFLVDATDADSISAAEAGGFRCVDVRITRERSVDGVSADMPSGVENFRVGDLPDLRAIARTSHGASRFYQDPHFSGERCDALYDAWISRACTETPDGVLVVRREGRAVAYLSCELDSEAAGTIGLVAVAENARGQHLGANLVEGALVFFLRHGRTRVRVVSQGRNLASARLYESLGFETTSLENWYHYWPNAGEGA
jgi:ribosomal protein S18 acetylase RimI-like enzyme